MVSAGMKLMEVLYMENSRYDLKGYTQYSQLQDKECNHISIILSAAIDLSYQASSRLGTNVPKIRTGRLNVNL